MTRRRFWVGAVAVALLVAIASLGTGRTTAAEAGKGKGKGAANATTDTTILFAADGMTPHKVERYAKQGAMPTIKQLMNKGVVGENGLLPAFPPNTGVGWYTLATGTWSSEHGSLNNTFHRPLETGFGDSTSFATPGILRADTLQQATERQGKTVVSM